MALPGRDEARDWVGRTVVDREGVELGPVTAVFADEATGLPEWMHVEVDGSSAIVPAVDADGSRDRVTVTVTREQVSAAPSVGRARRLSQAQEEQLYAHYGIAYSREASETLLPAEAAEAAGTRRRGRRTVPAVAALAGAAVLGVAVARRPGPRRPAPGRPLRRLRAGLGARRPWAPAPRTRGELAADRVRLLAARARVEAGHLGAAALPVAVTAADLTRRGAAAGAVQLGRGAAAGAVQLGRGARASSRAAARVAARARARL